MNPILYSLIVLLMPSSPRRASPLKELLDIKLQAGAREVQLIRLEHRRMKDSNLSNLDVPARLALLLLVLVTVTGEDVLQRRLDGVERSFLLLLVVRRRSGSGGRGGGGSSGGGVGSVGRGDGGESDVSAGDERGAVEDFGRAVGEVGGVCGWRMS